LVFETLAKMPPFSYNVANNNRHQKGVRKEASMNTIKAKDGVVNKNEVEAQFVGKNLTIVGCMGQFGVHPYDWTDRVRRAWRGISLSS
jgi:hypothetical protein